MLVEHDYPVSARRLAEVLTDPAYVVARSARFGGSADAVVSADDEVIVVTVPRQLPLEHVPGAFRRFVGDGLVVETARWILGREVVTATWAVDTARAPIDLSGTHRVIGVDGGCRHRVSADVRVHLPVGRRSLTRLVETHLGDLIRAEQRFAADWLEVRP